ncbi:MAG: type 4a pilus biogenesis protein PilO [bacterium]|nr:type 4a pilus biogenesis protein PilO [bacterium]
MNYKKLIGAGIAAIGFILFAILVWPLFYAVVEVREQIEIRNTALEQKKTIIDKIAGLKSMVDSRRTEINQLISVLPKEKKMHEVVVNIEDMANQSGVTLRGFQSAELASLEIDKSHKTIQVDLDGSGSYQSILNFIKLLEKNLRIFDVQGFTVALDTSGTGTGELNLGLKLFTYYLSSDSK